jgi:hydroxymethylpyrimidine/phosphomethylpyrimidine kinase
VLSIAGVDPSGGAGVLSDIKTFSALGAYGTAVLTALTAQNTRGVTGVEAVAPAFVRAQLDALFDDVHIDAIKVGMLANAEVARAVADRLERCRVAVVVDPVMVAKSGDRLLDESAIETLRRRVLPLATLVTPNLPEAEALTGRKIGSGSDMQAAGEALLALGPKAVLMKGGHLPGPRVHDVLVMPGETRVFESERIETRHTHGTGCTLASAIAAHLAKGRELPAAVREAQEYTWRSLAAAFRPGAGQSLPDRFFAA